MTLQGYVLYENDPMTVAVRGMTMQINILSYYTENIAHADTPGYQRKLPVINSFAEHLGMKGVDTVTDTSVGRIHKTLRPLDFALNTKGYFQKLQADGRVELTRDGRFRLDKDGNLLSNDFMPVLSRQGQPIRLPFAPDKLDRIKVKEDGWIELLNPTTGETVRVAQIGVASQDGSLADEINIQQGHVEASNVFLHEEFVGLVPPKRNFQANRQIFMTQSQALTRLIQEMGRAQ
jgi:flagellar basal-body rod protein FlgF